MKEIKACLQHGLLWQYVIANPHASSQIDPKVGQIGIMTDGIPLCDGGMMTLNVDRTLADPITPVCE